MLQKMNGRVMFILHTPRAYLHLLGEELREAGEHILAPLGEVHDERLQALEGQPAQLLVHVHRQPAQQLHQLARAHAFGDQPAGRHRICTVLEI